MQKDQNYFMDKKHMFKGNIHAKKIVDAEFILHVEG